MPTDTTTGDTRPTSDEVSVRDNSPLGSAASDGPAAGAPQGTTDGPVVRPAQFVPLQPDADARPAGTLNLLLDVNLNVTVELGRTSRSIREVLELGPGSIVELDRLVGEPVDILVNERPIARGEVVVVDDASYGVRITDIISQARRVQTLR